MNHIKIVCVLTLIFTQMALPGVRTSAQSYTITVLTSGTSQVGINASGQVCFGFFLWTPTVPNGTSGSLTVLPPLQSSSANTDSGAQAGAINAFGVVVGRTLFVTTPTKNNPLGFSTQSWEATFWQNGQASALKSQNGNSRAYGINDAGYVVGIVNNVATIWQNNNPAPLETPKSASSSAYGINNSAQIVGAVQTGSVTVGASVLPITVAALWEGGKLYQLGTLPGYNLGTTARAINTGGLVVGSLNSYVIELNGNIDLANHAFVWTPTASNGTSGQMLDLGTLAGWQTSWANAVNVSGQAVGECSVANQDWTQGAAFLWDSAHAMRNLNSLLPANSGWTIYCAGAINDRGQIVAFGYQTSAAASSTLLLTPQ